MARSLYQAEFRAEQTGAPVDIFSALSARKETPKPTAELRPFFDLLVQFRRHADLLIRDLQNAAQEKPELRTLLPDMIRSDAWALVLEERCAEFSTFAAIRADFAQFDADWRTTAFRASGFSGFSDEALRSVRAMTREVEAMELLLEVGPQTDRAALIQQLERNQIYLAVLSETLSHEQASKTSIDDWSMRLRTLVASTHLLTRSAKTLALADLQTQLRQNWKEVATLQAECRKTSSFALDRDFFRVRKGFREALSWVHFRDELDWEAITDSMNGFRQNLAIVQANLAFRRLIPFSEDKQAQVLESLTDFQARSEAASESLGAESLSRNEWQGQLQEVVEGWRPLSTQLDPLRARIYVDALLKLRFYLKDLQDLTGNYGGQEWEALERSAIHFVTLAEITDQENLATHALALQKAALSREPDPKKLQAAIDLTVRSSLESLQQELDPSISRELLGTLAPLVAAWSRD